MSSLSTKQKQLIQGIFVYFQHMEQQQNISCLCIYKYNKEHIVLPDEEIDTSSHFYKLTNANANAFNLYTKLDVKYVRVIFSLLKAIIDDNYWLITDLVEGFDHLPMEEDDVYDPDITFEALSEYDNIELWVRYLCLVCEFVDIEVVNNDFNRFMTLTDLDIYVDKIN